MEWLTVGTRRIPRIAHVLTLADRLGSWKARWNISRMDYIVPPGLYAVGYPGPDSPVLVTANYKMSYDIVRHVLKGRDCWLLVLETYGINVWCAAGKGTFGTAELVRRMGATGLAEIVRHRHLHLPILGAPGVAAHEVKKWTGFQVHYATIRAGDIPEYLDNGMRTTPAMREISFTTPERTALFPVEIVGALKPTLMVAVVLFALLALVQGYATGSKAVLAYLGAMLMGTAMTPFLLPWIPGRSFAFKGALMGLIWSFIVYGLAGGNTWSSLTIMATFLTLPVVSSFYALNFTGCTPFTSRSGVKKEMRIALPAMACAFLVGFAVAVLDKIL
jgi:acetyl-CoA decarbonylase/synthase complex subunit gamma